MKKHLTLFMAVLMLALFQRCTHDEDVPAAQVKVTFGFQTPDASNGRLQSLAGVAQLRISLESTSGDSVFLHKTMEILSFGGGYVTEPVLIAPGNYRVTEFMLVNDSSVLYATPLAGSPLAKAVKQALPFTFGVQAGKVTNVDLQVLAVNAYTPEQFGYASFHTTIITPLPIAVFAMGETPTRTSATVYILKDLDTLYTQSLGATADYIFFNLDPTETYKMIVFKDGYSYLDKTFVYNDLMAELQHDPLLVYLKPALTIEINLKVETYYNIYFFELSANGEANVLVTWGDGTTTSFSPTEDTRVSHNYPMAQQVTQKTYYVTVTGDLEKITAVEAGVLDGDIIDMNFDHLPSLLNVGFVISPEKMILDVRQNTKLEGLGYGGAGVLLPPTHNLKYVTLYNQSIGPSLDYVVHSVYENAVAREIKNGRFEYRTSWTDSESPPVAIPSSEALDELRTLSGVYGWITDPE